MVGGERVIGGEGKEEEGVLTPYLAQLTVLVLPLALTQMTIMCAMFVEYMGAEIGLLFITHWITHVIFGTNWSVLM